MQADVYFTDAQPGAVSLNPSSVTVSPGNTATYTATVTQSGNNNPCTLTFSLAYTGPTARRNDRYLRSQSCDDDECERELDLDHHDDEYW